MPHVLFVTEKWCDCNPAAGPTNSEHNFFSSLAATGLATHDRFHFDEYYNAHGGAPPDWPLIERCQQTGPHLVVLSLMPGLPHNPGMETIAHIHGMGIPIVALWFDTAGPGALDWAEQILPYVEYNVVVDSTTAYRRKTGTPEKYLPMWTPQDPNIYHNPGLPRDVELSFLGSMHNRPDRQAAIETLRGHGFPVHQTGGQRESRVSPQEYANILQRSRITLNFGRVAAGDAQAKGRIFEATLCGALLLDEQNPETDAWFQPMVDYVPFTDHTDLLQKVQHYLNHEDKRRAIAARGHEKAIQNYSAERWWRTLFAKLAERGRHALAI